MELKIEQAIKDYNEIHRKHSEPRMTKKRLGMLAMPERNIANAESLLFRLTKGRVDKIEIELVPKICESLKIDANYLFNI